MATDQADGGAVWATPVVDDPSYRRRLRDGGYLGSTDGREVPANALGHRVGTPENSTRGQPGRAAQGSFSDRGAFILGKVEAYDPAKLKDVLGDLYRDAVPEPMNITRFEWETILRFMGADAEEIRDVQVRMGRVWR